MKSYTPTPSEKAILLIGAKACMYLGQHDPDKAKERLNLGEQLINQYEQEIRDGIIPAGRITPDRLRAHLSKINQRATQLERELGVAV